MSILTCPSLHLQSLKQFPDGNFRLHADKLLFWLNRFKWSQVGKHLTLVTEFVFKQFLGALLSGGGGVWQREKLMLKENYIWQMLKYVLHNKNVVLSWEWFGCLSLVDLLKGNSERLEFWEFMKMLGCGVPWIPFMSASHLWGGVTLNSSTVVGHGSGHCPPQQLTSQGKNSPSKNGS